MIEYNELKREIEDTEAIIYALKASIPYAANDTEHDIYLKEISFREQSLKELRELVVN